MLALVLAAALAGGLPAGGAQQPDLVAVVGPGFTITLSTAAGQRVTRLDPGAYTIRVEDRSELHNFRLSGPGVERATTIEGVGTEIWTVTLRAGRYAFLCDPHATTMRGAFTVGTPPPPRTRLVATVGPGFTISLTRNGKRVRRLKPGPYAIVVRDRARAHNFHLTGRGLSRKTGVAFRGTRTWKVTLRRGTYRFVCDPHRRTMRGSFVVR